MKKSRTFTRRLLKALAVGGMVIIAAGNPYFGLHLARGIKKELERKKWREFYRDLHRLKRQKRIEITQNEKGQYLVTLTSLGHKIVKKFNLDDLAVKKPEQWDGCWRFFSFDIPGRKKTARQSLLSKLKELNFVMVQKSLWAHPFECREELGVIIKAFEVEPYAISFLAYEVDNTWRLERKFKEVSGITLSRITL